MAEIIEIKSEGAWEEFSDGTKLFPKEFAFKIDIYDFLNTPLTIQRVEKVMETLCRIWSLNKDNRMCLEYKQLVSDMLFNGITKQVLADYILRVNESELEKELEAELKKVPNSQKVVLVNRVDWEVISDIKMSFYRRMAFQPIDKNVDIKSKEEPV